MKYVFQIDEVPGKHEIKRPRKKEKRPKTTEFSKRLIKDIRALLWIVTIGGLLLAVYCIHEGYTASLPWLSAMVGLPWTAHGVVCSFYLNMAKSDHRIGGITYETARAAQFRDLDDDFNPESPAI